MRNIRRMVNIGYVAVESITPCREYQGYRNHAGYGVRSHRRPARVHVWVWVQVNGPVPEGMQILHKCDNPPCFRYDHLILGDHDKNMADMKSKGRARNKFPRNRRLTTEDVAALKTRYVPKSGTDGLYALAKEYGVTYRVVRQAIMGLILLVMLSGCGILQANHSNDPKSCRERAAYHVGSIYPDPNNLHTAIDAICGTKDTVVP